MLDPDLPVSMVEGHARDALGAADAALIASGTATLEAMLWRCPMVVAYRIAASSYALVKGLGRLRITHVSLPNLLAGRAVVPEFLQYRAIPCNMGTAMLKLLQDKTERTAQLEAFATLSSILRCGANERAADGVLGLLGKHATAARVYFAHPYCSWERGTNENTNGLIRQYFPKRRNLSTVTQQELDHAMRRLNHRPRERLGFKTPYEVFFHTKTSLTVALGT